MIKKFNTKSMIKYRGNLHIHMEIRCSCPLIEINMLQKIIIITHTNLITCKILNG